MMGLPLASDAAMAPPTGTLASAIKALPAGADPGATGEAAAAAGEAAAAAGEAAAGEAAVAAGEAAAEVGEAAAGVLEPPQAASRGRSHRGRLPPAPGGATA